LAEEVRQLHDMILKEEGERKDDVQRLTHRFDSSLGGLEGSLGELDFVTKKFKREKSDMLMIRDSLQASIDSLDQKIDINNTSEDGLARHCGVMTELLALMNDSKKSQNISKPLNPAGSNISIGYGSLFPPVGTESSLAQFKIHQG
jgi:phage terminase large subunit